MCPEPHGIVPVSVVAVEPNTVTAIRTTERDGYTAVQLGTGTARRLTKPRAGQLKGLPRVRDVREFRLADTAGYEVGQTLDVSLFGEGDKVDAIIEHIKSDPEIAVLVLGAGIDKAGPGPLVTALTGRRMVDLRVPITIVPGSMTKEDIIAAS